MVHARLPDGAGGRGRFMAAAPAAFGALFLKALAAWVLTALAVALLPGGAAQAAEAGTPARGEGAEAQGAVRALLVGVSGYPGLAPALRLRGPRNDVRRMQQLLLARGVADERIDVLADGLPGAGAPTRALILERLARLAAQARRGDTVVLMFAGHGSRQPAAQAGAPPEPLFLPLDVAGWDARTGRVVNAIAASELREAVDRIAARGALVWGIFDACHSARLVRGGAEGGTATEGPAQAHGEAHGDDSTLRWRQVSPQQLGIPAQALARADAQQAEALRTATRQPNAPLPAPAAEAGRSAFFYAAQAHEATPELALPAGVAGARVHGVFSHVLLSALERAGTVSYRQLAQQVLASYATLNEAQANPLFSGNALDTPIFGGAGAVRRQWPLEREGGGGGETGSWTVGAGALTGLAPGAVLAVLPDALADDTRRIGHLRVTAVQAELATLVPVAHAGLAAPAAAALRPGLMLRPVHEPPTLGLRVAWRREGCTGDCPLARAVARLQRDGVPGVAVSWVEATDTPELLLVWRRERIALRAPGREDDLVTLLPTAAETADPGALAARLATRLHTVARSRNLLRVAAGLAGRGERGLLATLHHHPAGGAAPQTLDGTAVATLRAGDRLRLELHNPGERAIDLTVLYFDAEHGVVALFPGRAGESNRIDPGTRQAIAGIEIHAPPTGTERLLLITSPARRLGQTREYAFLAQPPLSRLRGARAAEPEDGPDLFADAAFAEHTTRGGAAAVPAAAAPGVAVQMFTFDVRR